MDVLERLDALRIQKGWTVYTLAKQADLDATTITAWFNKGSLPNISSLQKICVALDITMSRFFADDEEPVVLAKHEIEMLNAIDGLNKSQKSALLTLIKQIPPQRYD